MECCHPTHQLSPCMPYTSRLDLNLQPEKRTVGEMLNYLFSPEASNQEHPPPEAARPAWLGPVKALLWAGNSIATGTVLAMLFS